MQQIIPKPEKNYLVMVKCFTYNQEKYIEDALKGFVMQKTNFPFVCLVVDDCSTDNTASIIKKYEAEYPEIIKGVYLTENHRSKGKPKYPYLEPWINSSKYIAICEGDDYWTNPKKLQKQVDYLEIHPKCGLVWAKAKCYHQEKGEFKGTTGTYMNGYYDMFIHYSISPLTVMYRKSILPSYWEFRKGQHFMMGDSPLFLYIAHNHDIHFMDEIVGVYRILRNSASHGDTYEKKVRFKNGTFEVVKFFYAKYGHPDFKQLESIHYSYLFNYAFNDARYQTAKDIYKQISYPSTIIRFKRIIASLPIIRDLYFLLFHKIIKKY